MPNSETVRGDAGRKTSGESGYAFAHSLDVLDHMPFISMFGAPLTYVAAVANLQLQDANLAYYDHLLGLDWPAYFSFATSHPLLLDYASAAYFAIWLPGVGVPLVLGLWGQFLRLQQFVMATILTLCAVMLVSALVPAFGTYYQYSLPADTDLFKAYGYLTQMKDLPMVRDGSLRLLKLQHLGGIITFPSFHAAAGILAIWGFWGIWWMRPPALITNVAMLLATPLVGGHYFVDVIAGVAVALLAIEATKAMSALLRDRSGRKAGDQLWSFCLTQCRAVLTVRDQSCSGDRLEGQTDARSPAQLAINDLGSRLHHSGDAE